jgi:hypothetical protein
VIRRELGSSDDRSFLRRGGPIWTCDVCKLTRRLLVRWSRHVAVCDPSSSALQTVARRPSARLFRPRPIGSNIMELLFRPVVALSDVSFGAVSRSGVSIAAYRDPHRSIVMGLPVVRWLRWTAWNMILRIKPSGHV